MFLGGIRYLLPAIESAHNHGFHVITVDYLPGNVAHRYSDEYHNVSIIDKDAILELAEKLNIDGILSFAVDPGVVSAAYVAEKMGLPFQCSYTSACILQNKAQFRKFLSDNGFNVPNAKGYSNVDKAIEDADYFNWPVIVKPVDSAGSKGVSKVEEPMHLRDAIYHAIESSHTKHFIIEDFLELKGYQSSADCFTINGELVYADFSDQLFDKEAANPYTPSMEIWPSSMEKNQQEYLTNELQRLFKLLDCKTGIYNVECRVCKDGKAYIMEVSPRAGGNRIAELQRIGTGIDLIDAEVCKSVGAPLEPISQPIYDGIYINYILHSNISGHFITIKIDDDFRRNHVIEEDIRVKEGDMVESFTGANTAIGTLFLKFESRKEMEQMMENHGDYIKIHVK